MAKTEKKPDPTLARNRKAFHEYHIAETFEAGIELQGTEVKSCRARNVSLIDSFVKIESGEAYLHNAHIAPYEQGNRFNHEPKRKRKLLLHKREILKLTALTREAGMTVVPLDMHLTRGRMKLSIAAAKGKKLHDKRESLRKAEDSREVRRAMKR
jgi:SsrA-binding protein